MRKGPDKTGHDEAAASQLGFDALLTDAEIENRARQFERETGHLPDTMAAALPFYCDLLRQHHAAMLAADVDETMRLREEANRLALRLNGGAPGILAGLGSPGNVLTRETAARPGTVPLWGQTGDFIITVDGMRVRIALAGIFGIGAGYSFWPGFAAHAVDHDRPFLSPTGFRSFLGIHADPVAGMSPDDLARKVIEACIARDLNGCLIAIEERYRGRDA